MIRSRPTYANGDSPENNIIHFQQPNVLNEEIEVSFEMKGFGDITTSQPTSHVFPTDQADASSCAPKNRIFSDQADLGLARGSLDQQKRKMHLFEKNLPNPKVHESKAKFCYYDLVFGVSAIVIFLFDIVTDVMMVVHYFREKQYEYGGVTAALVAVSSMITCLLGLHWYLIDYHKEKKRTTAEHLTLTPKYVWGLRILCTLFMLGPVVRIIEYLYYGLKSRNIKCHQEEREKYKQAMLYKDLNSCLLRLFESFLESAPQLAWQIYISIKLKRASDTISISLLVGTLLSSWMSLAMSLLSYHKSLRNSNDLKAKMSFKSLPFYFIWRLSEVGGRILCIAFFASAFDLWVFGILTLHWIIVSVWLIMQNTSFYKKNLQEKLFNLICSFVMIFCFLNMREGHTRYRVIIFYLLVYIENAFMLAFWFRFTKDLGAWFHIWGFIVVLVLFALHVSFQVVYYTLFHPTQNIPLCLSCDRHTIYSSMCDDVTHSRREESPAENVNAPNTNQPLESCTPMLSGSLSL
uniref:XK-related protein n=1 Tax=Biomphalaria glabrata TaxID=6526 RepID=A0A2C9LVW8_BIOGL